MATDYNKILLDKGYTQAQIDAMRGAANAGASNKDIVAAGGTPVSTPSKVTTPTTTTTTTKTNNSNATKANTNIAKPEYQGTGTVNNPTPSYQHQGEGNYVYNPTSGYYEKQSTPATSTSTSTSTPTTGTDKNASAREMWDSKSYQEQQNLLNKSPSLREKVLSIGGTIKTAPEEGTPAKTDTTGTTPSTEWDYQDNSPERMAQMVDNLERIYQSNPGLFDNEQAFRNAFINGVNRSPEQEAFLMDYFKNRQIYNEYDGYTSEKVGYMEAHGQCPQSYLNYVKNSNPQRYAEIMDSKDKTEKGIENDTYYSDLLKNSGFEDSSNLAWQKKEGLLVDENGDKIDDRRYHEMSAEEKQYRDEEATLQSENLKLEEALRNLDEDLIDQYPDADYSTIMLLRSDRGSKIQKQIASNNVTITKLQGMINYMQSERQQQDKAGAETIAQLQKQYGMYYQYTPEGMSELLNAQYEAANPSLASAENGTETDKRRALDSVLTGYFDKYGSIIERPKEQVINDVLAYAKNNGVTLEQALQENFVKYLKQKPDYKTLSTGRTIQNATTDKWAKLTDDKLFNTVTGDIIDANGNVIGNTGGVGSTSQTGYGKNYTVISSTQLVSGLGDFLDGYNEGDKGGQCGAFINNGLKKIGAITENIYDNSLDSKLKSKNEEADATAQTGWVAIYDPTKLKGAGAQHGHVGWVVRDNGDGTVAIIDSNGTKNAEGKYDETVGYHPSVPKSSLYGYFNPTKSNGSTEDGELYYAKVLSWIPTQLRNTDVEKQWYIDIAKEQKEKGLTPFEAAMSIIGFDITNKSQEAQDTKNKILDVVRAQGEDTMFNSAVLSSMAESINRGDNEGALRTLENQLGNYMSTKLGTEFYRDSLTEAAQAISDLNKMNTNWAQGTWNTLSNYLGGEGSKTAKYNSSIANLKSTLRKLGFTDDDIDDMVPQLTNTRSVFKTYIDELEKNIMNKYNAIRRQHGMPAESRASLLGNVPLSSVYGLNAEGEAMQSI